MTGLQEPARALVVVSEQPYLEANLFMEVDRGNVLVLGATPVTAAEVMSACTPFPWMVITDCAALPAGVLDALASRPIIPICFRCSPPGLPAHARRLDGSPHDVAQSVSRALNNSVGGMRLAPTMNVALPTGDYVNSAFLEALISTYPDPWAFPPSLFRAARETLSRHGVPWAPQQAGSPGTTVLAPVDRAAP